MTEQQQEGKKRGFEEHREVSAAILHNFIIRLETEPLIIWKFGVKLNHDHCPLPLSTSSIISIFNLLYLYNFTFHTRSLLFNFCISLLSFSCSVKCRSNFTFLYLVNSVFPAPSIYTKQVVILKAYLKTKMPTHIKFPHVQGLSVLLQWPICLGFCSETRCFYCNNSCYYNNMSYRSRSGESY